ncbi:MAG: hypothetical protein R3C14_54765 [Caldilineaceae bacterium]
MPDFHQLPLDQLLLTCPPLLQIATPVEAAAWRELLRRALVERNDGAWDALVLRLWTAVLFWVYARVPEIPPAAAELYTHRTLWEFRRRHLHSTMSQPRLLDAVTITALLQECIASILEQK